MRWLHLSDIHVCMEKNANDRQFKVELFKLISELATKGKFDHIFLTGDYRDAQKKENGDDTKGFESKSTQSSNHPQKTVKSGNKKSESIANNIKEDKDKISREVKAAADFIIEVAKTAKVTTDIGEHDPKRIHLVPGNHDLTRKDEQAINEIISKYQSSIGVIEFDDRKKLYDDRFDFFLTLQDSLGIKKFPNRLFTETHLHPCETFDKFNLLCLNTSITSTKDDVEKLVIGRYELQETLIDLEKKPKPLIVLAHHNTECLKEEECKVVRSLFKNYSQNCGGVLYLCGHFHKSREITMDRILEVTMGCLNPEKKKKGEDGDDVEIAFSVGEFINDKLSIFSYQWRKNMWVEDPATNFMLKDATKDWSLLNRNIKTKQEADEKKISKLEKREKWYGGATILFACILLFSPLGYYLRYSSYAKWEKNEAEKKTALEAQQEEERKKRYDVQLHIAQLPGLNGGWWFEEIPWLIPPVRKKLMEELEKCDADAFEKLSASFKSATVLDVTTLLRKNTVKHVGDENDENYVGDLSPAQETLVRTLLNNNSGEEEITRLQRAKNAFETSITKNSKDSSAIDWHTLANLKHRLAILNESVEEATDAKKAYKTALERYEIERGEKTKELGPLEILCHGDYYRICFAISAIEEPSDEDKLFSDSLKLCSPDGVSRYFEIEFHATFGNYAKDAGKFEMAAEHFRVLEEHLEEWKNDLRINQSQLRAYFCERRAWYFMDRWRVNEARELFTTFAKTIRAIPDVSRWGQKLSSIDLNVYNLHNAHGEAIAARYLADSINGPDIDVKKKYGSILSQILDQIDKKEKEPPIGDRRNLLKLYERAGNTYERLADCTFYGGAAIWIQQENFSEENATVFEEKDVKTVLINRNAKNGNDDKEWWDKLRVDAHYAQAAFFYKEAKQENIENVMKGNVMQLKQSIMLMLLGNTEKGKEIYNLLPPNPYLPPKDSKENVVSNKLIPAGGNQTRYEMLYDLADAVYKLKKCNSPCKLRNFLKRFPYPNSSKESVAKEMKEKPPFPIVEVGRRENLEIWLFASELLLRYRLAEEEKKEMTSRDYTEAIRDSQYLISALAVFQQVCDQKKEQLKFINRYTDVLKVLNGALEEAQKNATGNRVETVNQ